MQLVAYGAQDVYLTGSAQVTFWKVVYRRHTNFSMETVEHTLDGNPDFGRESTVTVLRNGDLAHRMCLKVELKAVSINKVINDNITDSIAYVRRLGHALIKEIEVEIGGSRIDKHYGVWLDIWYELTHKYDKERGYRAMIGDVPELTQLQNVLGPENFNTKLPAYTLYIPLQFWFNRNVGSALPLIALQYHDVRINIKFEDIRNLVVYQSLGAINYREFGILNASLLIDYIYLDSEERRRFAQVGHEYLIEQLQHTGVESITGANTKLRLGFNHPCKEIIWAVRNGAFNGSGSKNGGNKFLAYTHDDNKWTNGEDSVLENAAKKIGTNLTYYLETEQDLFKSGVDPSTEYRIVSLPDPNENLSQIITFGNDKIKINIINQATTQHQRQLFIIKDALAGLKNARNGISNIGVNKIHEITIVFRNGGSHIIFDATVNSHSLSLADISVPVNYFAIYNNGTSDPNVTIVQPNNYGLLLDGTGNPIELANIQLNGHDRFDPQDGNYFNYYQTDAHHTRTPADGINVYSFALNPELHQPSGSANLSRVDNTQLNVAFADNVRNKNDINLDLFTDSQYYVFGINYNILRVMSGMCGVAYAN